MGEGIQKTILQCVFRVFAISHDPMNDTEDFFDMPLAKLSEGGSSSSLGGCYQLLLAPRSRSLTAGVSLCTEKNVVITTMDFLLGHVVVPSIFFSVHPLADVRRAVLKRHPVPLATP
jgi:hypothetical protein